MKNDFQSMFIFERTNTNTSITRNIIIM